MLEDQRLFIQQQIMEYANNDDADVSELVTDILTPHFTDISQQKTAYDGEGNRHYTDFEGTAKHDIVISPHPDDYVRQGEKVSVEIKTGSLQYLETELKNHAIHQAEAHEGKSVILTSQDFYDLPVHKQQELRANCRENNTMIVAGLPRVSVIDECLLRASDRVLDANSISGGAIRSLSA